MNISAIGKSSTGSTPSTPAAPSAPAAAPAAAPAGGMRFASSGARRLAPPADNSSHAFEDQPDDFDQRYGITSGDSESSAGKSNKPAKPAQDSIESDDTVEETDETKTPAAPKEDLDTSFERETKKDDTEDDEDETVADEPAADNQELPAKRDYTALDPEIAKIAKKLPNHLYARVVPKLTEYKKLADQVPTLKAEIDNLAKSAPRYLAEHPESFKITPQYQEAVQIYNDATAENSHWRQQLFNIESGKPWVELLGYGQNGEPLTREHKPLEDGKIDIQARIAVMDELAKISTAKQHAQQQAAQVRANHKNFYDGARREFDATKAKFFPKLAAEELGAEEKAYVDRVKAQLPQAYRDHPLADGYPLAFLTVRRLAKYTAELEAKLKNGKAAHAPAVGPRKAAVGKGSRGSTMIDLNKEFPSSD